MRLLFTLIAICCITTSTKAQGLFYEDFNYGNTAGYIITLSTGKWVENTTASTTNIIQYDPSSSLSFPNFTSNGGKLNTLNTGQDITSALSSAVTSNNLYAAFLVNFSAAQTTGDYFFHFMPNTTTNTLVGRVFVKLNGSNINFGLMKNNGGSVPYSNINYSLSTTYCVVLKYAFNPDGTTNDIASLFVFDAATGLPVSEPSNAELSISTNTDATSLGAIAIRQGAATAGASASFDKIVVDTTWPNFYSTLPTTLQSFNAKSLKNGVELNWKSIHEINFNFYQLEKSTNGTNFSPLAIITGKSVNGNETEYNFFDAAAIADKQYYRLKMVDKDGKSKYSSIVAVNSKSTLGISLYPNPATSNIVVTHPPILNKDVLNIYNTNGMLVKTVFPVLGTVQTSFSVEDLPKGSYTLSYSKNGTINSISFIK